MKAKEFLKYTEKHYNQNKKKWTARLKKQGLAFSEDIFQDTIWKIYSHIDEYSGDIESYWYKAFLTNTKRDGQYHYHKRDDDVDVYEYLSDVPADEPPILLEDIEDGFKALTEVEKYLFLIYYLTDISYAQLEELTGIKNLRYKIKQIIKKIKKKA